MKQSFRFLFSFTLLFFSLSLSSFDTSDKSSVKFPYKKADLTERQAAAHLLSRFTYGAKPGDIDKVLKIGLEKWFLQQLKADLPDDSLNRMLSQYDALQLSNEEVIKMYPKGAQVRRMAIREGIIDKDSVNKSDLKQYRSQLEAYMRKKGLRPQQDLYRQFISQKILRAAYTHNQLQELLTDFWFNHFNVSITKNDCAEFIPAYERDVIRLNALGKFSTLLLTTAKSPAMLMYLDNFRSSAENSSSYQNNQAGKRLVTQMQLDEMTPEKMKVIEKLQAGRKNQGLNENYAREVMELHTLGVDGGYTQSDVTEAARVLTGWTVYPLGEKTAGRKFIETIGEGKLSKRGFVHEGDFLFAMNRHDKEEKVVLGKKFAANGGYEEGVELLDMLAHHPSTAKFISRKLAIRFVSDSPPQTLIDKMADTFAEKDGDIREVLRTMVSAPEFWTAESLREKTKSPFELAISAVRSLDADIQQPYQLYNWVNKMGQKMYFYQAPTGFPDRGQYWINTGSLLNRMNFGLALASQQIPGVRLNLTALNNNREPESAEAALLTYSKLLLPERDLDETVKRLTPMLTNPDLRKKVDEAARKTTVSTKQQTEGNEDAVMDEEAKIVLPRKKVGRKNNYTTAASAADGSNMLSQVVGIIIGSPEFQRK